MNLSDENKLVRNGGKGGTSSAPDEPFDDDATARQNLRQSLEGLLTNSNLSDDEYVSIRQDFQGFDALFAKYLESRKNAVSIDWEQIEPLPKDAIVFHEDLSIPQTRAELKSMLEKLVVVKLNGGLGTSMGCKGPKSMIEVRKGKTFLDLTLEQVEHLNRQYDVDIPFVLMNSFNTAEETEELTSRYGHVRILNFNQSRYPRIGEDSLLPVTPDCRTKGNKDAWYPPGHGDFYQAFNNSGLLDQLLAEGKQYCFLSNIDNLGATVDLGILDVCVREHLDFVMELTDKTRADVKGGTLIQYQNKLRLLEVAQVPKEHVKDFTSMTTFSVFNTNNLWMNLRAVKNVLKQGTIDMEVIVNPKKMANGNKVIQLETAVGAAMKSFDRVLGINVPRSRFLPVKKTSDLFMLVSNLYATIDGKFLLNPKRPYTTMPALRLDEEYFKTVSNFMARFPSMPDIVGLESLIIVGDVTFGRNITLRGTVVIIADRRGGRITVPSNTVLENQIVRGELEIINY